MAPVGSDRFAVLRRLKTAARPLVGS